MEPNAGPNRTQTAPWNSQHGIWTSYHKAICNLKGDLKVNLEPKWFLRRFPWKFHVSDFRATLLFTSYCTHVLITIQVPGLWWGKNWNQNTSKKRSWLIFRYVLGSVFVAQPSKVSRNRQKTWQRREKKQATWKDNKYQQTNPEDPKYGLFACIWVCTLSERPTMLFAVWPSFLHAFPTAYFPIDFR